MKSYKLYDENRMEVQRELAILFGFSFLLWLSTSP